MTPAVVVLPFLRLFDQSDIEKFFWPNSMFYDGGTARNLATPLIAGSVLVIFPRLLNLAGCRDVGLVSFQSRMRRPGSKA